MKAGKLLNRTIFTILSLHLISPGTLTHPKYKYLNINICRRVRPPYTDEDKRDKLTL